MTAVVDSFIDNRDIHTDEENELLTTSSSRRIHNLEAT